MNHTKLFLCLWLVPFLPCNAQRLLYPNSIPVEEIRVSPEHAMGGNVSDYLEHIQYFKLEKPNNGWIDQIETAYAVAGRLILIDDINSKMYIYGSEGNLIRDNFADPAAIRANYITNNIDNRSLYISKFNKEKENDRGIVLDGDRYNLQGEWQEEFILCTQEVNGKPTTFGSCVKLNDSTWAFYESPRNSHFKGMDTPLVFRTDSTITPILRIDTLSVDFRKIKMYTGSGFFTSVLNGEMVAYYSHPFSYEVVEISSIGIEKIYKFVLPQKHTVPENIYELPEYQENTPLSYFQDIDRNHPLIREIDNIIRYRDYLLFSFDSYSVGGYYAYSLKDKELVNIRHLVPDESNGFMPLFSRMNSQLFSDGEYLYSIVYAQEINESIRDFYGREKRTVPNWIKDLTDYDNPILVRFKLKS